MSPAGDSAAPLPRSDVSLFEVSRVATLYRLPVYVACAVLALAVNYLLGKEMAWDTLNHHLYLGFSAVHDRFARDYFAAGVQAYFNPYAYLPFYALASSGLSALQVASLLALLHAIILCLTYELALVAFPSGERRLRVGIGVCAVALASVNPILLQQIGTSFNDITTGELVLAGWLLLATAVRAPSAARVILAGALLGAASALKLSNSVHAIAAAAVLIMLQRPFRERLRYLATYALTLGAGFAIVAAPWSYRLEKTFGNPFFPLLNNVFRSPEFTTEPLRHLRFIPSSFAEALWRPFATLNPVQMVQEELSSPDPRYAVLLVLAGVLLMQSVWRRYRPVPAPAPHESPVDARVLAALGCGFTVDWVLWLTGSGNGRYFLPMGCVAAVLLVGLLFRVCATRAKVRNYVLAAIFATQALQLWMGAELRWNGVAWNGGPWFDVEVPERLASEPALYLSMDSESHSFIVPYLAQGAGMITFSSTYPLGLSGANGARVAALIRRHTPHLRVLVYGARVYPDGERRTPSVSDVNGAVRRFGLRADTQDCATITVHGLPPGVEIQFASSLPARNHAGNQPESGSADTSYLVSCGLVPDYSDHSSELAGEQSAGVVLDRLEDACPQLFQPRRPPTDNRGTTWRRYYINSDLVAWVSHDEVKFTDQLRDDNIVHLGRESDWLRAPMKMSCGRSGRHYFATVLGPVAAR
jgi:hypothetical protein